MKPITQTAAAIALAVCTTGAIAADLGGIKDAPAYPQYEVQPAPHRQFYVRGDVGIGHFNFGGFRQDDVAANGGSFISQSMADTVYIGAGLGWQVNPRFRFDLTGEYRATARLKGMDNLTAALTGPDGILQSNTTYDGNLASYVGLLNGYWDIFNWRGFTPYVGAGIGFAHHKMTGFTTASSATFTDDLTGVQTVQLSNGVARDHSQTNLAWALMAGTSYDLSPNGKLDLGYRYINLGSDIAASTGIIDCVCGNVGGPLKVSDLSAHEIRLGVRWMLGEAPRYVEPYRPLK